MKIHQCRNKKTGWKCFYLVADGTFRCENPFIAGDISLPLKYVRCCPHANEEHGGHDLESKFRSLKCWGKES